MSEQMTRRRLISQGTTLGLTTLLAPTISFANPVLGGRVLIAIGRKYALPAIKFVGEVVS